MSDKNETRIEEARPVKRDKAGNVLSPKKERRSAEERAARKARAGLAKLPDPPKDLLDKDVTELNGMSDDLDAEILKLRSRKREVHAARVALLAAQHAAYYGLTPEQYREVKAKAREEGTDLNKVMSEARKLNAVQVAKAGVASVGAKAKGVGK